MSAFISLSQAEFEEKVVRAARPVLVDFSAPWCGPCKRLEPELQKLAERLGEGWQYYQINVDEAGELAGSLMVLGVPTVILFVDGQEKKRLSGYQPLSRLLDVFGKQ
jgi:thioredoxin 1